MNADQENDREADRDSGRKSNRFHRSLLGLSLLLAAAGLVWLGWAGSMGSSPIRLPEPTPAQSLTAGVVASMQNPVFRYSPGWTLGADGADPGEPVDPWNEPSGAVEFTYEGSELALQLATGDYWGYLYLTVDGEPASELPVIRGNADSQGMPAGYKPLYDPGNQPENTGRESVWVRVHEASDTAKSHNVRIEIWRGWGQTPLRAVAVDALPPEPPPSWPGVALLVAAFWLAVAGLSGFVTRMFSVQSTAQERLPGWLNSRLTGLERYATGLAAIGLALAVAGTALDLWFICLGGLAVAGPGRVDAPSPLDRSAALRPALLLRLSAAAAAQSQLQPHRYRGLWGDGDLGIYIALWLLRGNADPRRTRRDTKGHEGQFSLVPLRGSSFSKRRWFSPGWMLAALVSWSLIAASAAAYTDVALHEWRTIFLAGGVFALLLVATLATSSRGSAPRPPILREARQGNAGLEPSVPPKVGGLRGHRDRRLILWGWLAGATVVSLVGLWQFAAGSMLIDAEGVQRIRAFYGSPNNLALYLERSLTVTLALGLFMRERRSRVAWLVLAGIQGAALLLTFSKGALLLALPVMVVVLWLGGLRLLRQSGQSTRPLWLLAGLAAVGFLAMTPFLGTERFQRLLDFSQGTGFLRLQLWRSSWQMALDHLPFGVGPDNFLYAYRSGYILPQAWQEPNLNHPHNWLLDWWTRLGLIGLALGLGFWAGGIARLWRRFRSAGEETISEALTYEALHL